MSPKHPGPMLYAKSTTALFDLISFRFKPEFRVTTIVYVHKHRIDVQGVLHVLEAVRAAGLTHETRIYQASTSELYGKVAEVPQTELTPFYPRSPYAVSKLFGFWIVKNYR